MAAAAKEVPAVDACIRSLEEERRGIEVFRCKLPLCVRLLADVVEVMKEEAGKRREDGDAEARAEDGDKRKWISTAQLWVDSRGSDADSERSFRYILESSSFELFFEYVDLPNFDIASDVLNTFKVMQCGQMLWWMSQKFLLTGR